MAKSMEKTARWFVIRAIMALQGIIHGWGHFFFSSPFSLDEGESKESEGYMVRWFAVFFRFKSLFSRGVVGVRYGFGCPFSITLNNDSVWG
ncbi:hypothetical protein TanjilG_25033 [Lupinus angustifolius]|uniref:Uncharacterized protein n=1 Tax=Lupinus angustifolius TaxID=3871 RepID=A0A1J7FMM5_LUPAN|nr:hypothetical protein TanjilG_25033 [Lupinus angustifolius]